MGWFRRSAPEPPPSPSGPAITELNDAERAWVAESLAAQRAGGVADGDIVALGAAYDGALGGWLALPPEERPGPNDAINRFGIGFGEHLRLNAGLAWVVASDEYGTELALHGQPGDVELYPANLVAKRWVAGETGVLPGLAAELIGRVAQVRGG
ncbi:DUF3806 domain-containing protein [Jiangella mangrovi]|uniref:DUF3806 domain-containing protein n=1 Tax=Jiangella mangrovi TaxID=1524084 RepID=A0A7W9GQ69_9ACTN|nr:DUF3806 domain-containing protein [Jiangella mangrovi]MBB5788030.1 hypothetical protein [Jiangella mangrovi]